MNMTNEQLTRELMRAYRCIQGMHSTITESKIDFPQYAYHSLTIGAAKRSVYENALDGSEYFIGKPAAVLHEALALGVKP